MIEEIINYLKKAQTPQNHLIGIYQHGSTTLGYNDNESDLDIAAVWEPTYPEKQLRTKAITELPAAIQRIQDSDHKASEYFEFKDTQINISHRLSSIFFNHYSEAISGDINEFNIYGLGGFSRGIILYDPENKLQKYKDSLVVTTQIIEAFKTSRANGIKNNLEDLRIASKRKQVINSIKNLNFLLTTFQIIYYLEKNQFPIVPKWFEHDAQKFGWSGGVLDIISVLKSQLAFGYISDSFEKLAKQ